MSKSIAIYNIDSLTAFLRDQGCLEPTEEKKGESTIRLFISLTHDNHGIDDVALQNLVNGLQSTQTRIEALIILAPIERSADPRMTQFCHSVGNISTLKELTWFGSFELIPFRDNCMQNVTAILRRARNLEMLICHDILFDGETHEFEEFAQTFNNHASLKGVYFRGCKVADGKQVKSNVNPVLMALSSVVNLRELSISCWILPLTSTSSGGSGTPSIDCPLSQLCLRPSLVSLDITDTDTGGQGILAWSAALCNSRSITTLSLQTDMLMEECRVLGEIVRSNEVIQKLILCIGHFEDDQHMMYLISALEENSTITELVFNFRAWTLFFSTPVQEAFVSMLERKNFALLSVTFILSQSAEVRNLEMEDMVEYFLVLNRSGRKILLEDPTTVSTEQWISTLISAKDSLDALFYFLSTNPSLCG